MTSDAKIGLLLGLIFIFIIAIILNGLPSLHGRTNSNQVTAQDLSNLSSSSDTLPVQPTGVASSWAAPIVRASEDVRYRAPLGNIGSPEAATAPAPAAEPDRLTETAPVADAATIGAASSETHLVEISSPVAPVVSVDTTADSAGAPVTSATEEFKVAAEYVIESGDSPAKIAMKFYGPEEGNRLVNVDRLMAANKITDPTRLMVGKKLIIPALPDGPERLVATHPDTFVRTGSTATATTATSTTKTQTGQTPSTKEYVVVQGDSLWTIAARTLGSGTRYKEILKLNSDRLGSDGSKLMVGMKLRVPAQ